MKDIDRIASLPVEEAVDISKHVEVTFSDSAHVKAVLTAPEMRVSHDSSQNYEFQKGVLIVFYDEDLKESQRIKSDYALMKTEQELTLFKKNVVVNLADGSVVKTEELYHDGINKKYYNHVPITFFFTDARGYMEATSFESNLDFSRIDGENMTALRYQSGSNFFPSF